MIDRRLLALTLCLLCAGCVARGTHDPSAGEAVRAVERAQSRLDQDDFGPMHTAFDYDYRLEELTGDIWRSGSRADQDELVALGRTIYEDTTRKYWSECCAGAPMTASVARLDGEHVWVTSRAPQRAGESFAFEWQYRLTNRGGTWRITQREFRDTHGRRSASTRFWPMAITKISSDFGRTPTLRELTANIPSMQGRLKARTVQIGKLPK